MIIRNAIKTYFVLTFFIVIYSKTYANPSILTFTFHNLTLYDMTIERTHCQRVSNPCFRRITHIHPGNTVHFQVNQARKSRGLAVTFGIMVNKTPIDTICSVALIGHMRYDNPKFFSWNYKTEVAKFLYYKPLCTHITGFQGSKNNWKKMETYYKEIVNGTKYYSMNFTISH